MGRDEEEEEEGGRGEANQRYRYGEIEGSTSSDLSANAETMDGRDETTIDESIGGRGGGRGRGGGGAGGDDVRRLLDQQQRILEQLMKDREGTNKTLRKVEKDLTDLKGENIVLQVPPFPSSPHSSRLPPSSPFLAYLCLITYSFLKYIE